VTDTVNKLNASTNTVDTDVLLSDRQLVIFSPTVHFKNECLNIHTYILLVSIFSYKNTPLCIECC